jgi:hypothetical protein
MVWLLKSNSQQWRREMHHQANAINSVGDQLISKSPEPSGQAPWTNRARIRPSPDMGSLRRDSKYFELQDYLRKEYNSFTVI